MKTKTLKKIGCVCALVAAQEMAAQDFHLSQYDAAPQYLNPALTGIYFKAKSDYRFYANYRSQWKSLAAKPYSTSALAYDMEYKKFGIGGLLLNNRSGIGKFNTLSFLASGAYRIADDEAGPHNLSAGLQIGLFYKSFSPDKFSYDSQYSESAPSGFDPSISSGESFAKTSLLKFDANMGVFYKYIEENKKVSPFAGLSIYHITKPNESFTDKKVRLPMRFVGHGGADIRVNDKLKLIPTVLYMNQAKAYDLNIGLMAWYTLASTEFDVMLGADYRYKDAVVIQAGLKQGEHVFRISYDVNVSYLNAYSGGKGGIEFSLLLNGVKGQKIFQPAARY